jgi:hypothetical protein
VGVAGGFAVFGAALALGSPASPSCTPTHRCHHVLHVGPSTSPTAHVAWDSKERFAAGQVAVGINYSPKLPIDTGLRLEPIGDCGVHFVLPARFTGVATRCGSKLQPLHVQVANVNSKHLRVGVTYWVPAPLFTG